MIEKWPIKNGYDRLRLLQGQGTEPGAKSARQYHGLHGAGIVASVGGQPRAAAAMHPPVTTPDGSRGRIGKPSKT